MSDSVWPRRRQPTRLPHLWDSPGNSTVVGCHFCLQCIKEKRKNEVAQSCPTLCNPMDCSLPASSVHGVFQARVLEWVAMPSLLNILQVVKNVAHSSTLAWKIPWMEEAGRLQSMGSQRVRHEWATSLISMAKGHVWILDRLPWEIPDFLVESGQVLPWRQYIFELLIIKSLHYRFCGPKWKPFVSDMIRYL